MEMGKNSKMSQNKEKQVVKIPTLMSQNPTESKLENAFLKFEIAS